MTNTSNSRLHEHRADGCLQPLAGPLQTLAGLERIEGPRLEHAVCFSPMCEREQSEGSSANFDHCMDQLDYMRRDALATVKLCLMNSVYDCLERSAPPLHVWSLVGNILSVDAVSVVQCGRNCVTTSRHISLQCRLLQALFQCCTVF